MQFCFWLWKQQWSLFRIFSFTISFHFQTKWIKELSQNLWIQPNMYSLVLERCIRVGDPLKHRYHAYGIGRKLLATNKNVRFFEVFEMHLQQAATLLSTPLSLLTLFQFVILLLESRRTLQHGSCIDVEDIANVNTNPANMDIPNNHVQFCIIERSKNNETSTEVYNAEKTEYKHGQKLNHLPWTETIT